jgi:lipopolysaccharide export LptBFGC system permease protein LptF
LTLVSVLLAAPVNHRGLRSLLAFLACVAYWALIFVGESGNRLGYLSPPLGAWLPNLALGGLAGLIAASRVSRHGRPKPDYR